MELIYHVMDTLLPFSWTEYTFMKNALLAVLLITQRPLNQEFLRRHWSMYLLIPAVLLLSIVPLRVG